MWPWEHLAVGYLFYSFLTRVRTGSPPDWMAALVLAFGTQFPDLIDKPLAWELGLLPSGNTLAHSLFTALPLSVLVLVLTKHRGVPRLGIAFTVGYLLHLPGDVFYPLLYGNKPWLDFLLWPIVPAHGGNVPGFIYELRHLIEKTVRLLSSSSGRLYLALEGGLLSLAVAVWYVDGMPGVGVIRITIARVKTQI